MEETRARVREILEREVAQVDSPETAGAVAERLERLAEGTTEHERGQRAESSPAPAEAQVASAASAAAAGGADRTREASETLLKAAETASAQTEEGKAVLEGALEALQEAPAPREVERGRALLKDAVLQRMGRLQRLDARIYLAVNSFPHAPWSDRAGNLITTWTTGGWIWSAGLLSARLLGARRAKGAFWDVLPSVAIATWIVEHPLKALFRRRRPFVDIVRALVVGKKPGSWSFPSGHTAASFAGAFMVSKIWPRYAPLFFALASMVGFSRVYVGAHYPGDVVSGAGLGMSLSEIVFRLNRLLRDLDA
ncbi:MAG TPA: phosphatase PAP2 family protein [Chloroflexota bacterium]|nr:phosphatase PAP2 family protein [Chloroflexota bacterium]